MTDPKTLTPSDVQSIANMISRDLFTNGDGENADRLIMWSTGKDRNLGGWSEPAVNSRIRTLLNIWLENHLCET